MGNDGQVSHILLLMQGREEEYTYHFTKEDVGELTAAVNSIKSSGVTTEQDILKVFHVVLKQ